YLTHRHGAAALAPDMPATTRLPLLGWPRMRLQRKSRSARRLRTSLLMCLGLAVSLSTALAQDKAILGAQSSGLNVNKPAHFPIWRRSRLALTRVLTITATRWI